MIFLNSTKIKLREHDYCSSIKFKHEIKLIHTIFGNKIIDFHHIGSTSVPRLIARPIIDIGIVISSLPIEKEQICSLKNLGYLPEYINKFHGEMSFLKFKSNPCNLKIFEPGNPNLSKLILFREALISDNKLRNEYARLKAQLAKEFANDLRKYNSEKELFIDELVSEYQTKSRA